MELLSQFLRHRDGAKIGDSLTFQSWGCNFTVKRLRKSTWHLRRDDLAARSRFGTLTQIKADIASVLETGALPGGDKWRF